MMKTFYNEETRQLERKLIENLLQELKCFTMESQHKYIMKKVNRYLKNNKDSMPVDKVFDYNVKQFKVQLLDETGPFLGVEVFNLEGVHCSHQKNYESFTLKIKDFQVINLLTKNEEERLVVSCLKKADAKDCYNFMMNLEKFHIIGRIHENRWKVFNNIEASMGTIIARFSLDVFEKIYDFIWMNKMDNLFQDADDLKLESELAECFFWNPNNFLKKKQEVLKRRKKQTAENNKNQDKIKSVPSVYKRFAMNKNKVYLTYKSGFRPIVVLLGFK